MRRTKNKKIRVEKSLWIEGEDSFLLAGKLQGKRIFWECGEEKLSVGYPFVESTSSISGPSACLRAAQEREGVFQ